MRTDCGQDGVRRMGDRMQTQILISMLTIMTTAAVMLAIQAVSLIVQLRRRTASNKGLIDYSAKLQSEADEGRKTAEDAKKSAQACRESCRAILNRIPEIVLVHGVDAEGNPGPVAEVNEAACNRLGLARDAILGMDIADLLAVDVSAAPDMSSGENSADQARRAIQRTVRTGVDAAMKGEVVCYEGMFRAAGGRKVPCEVTVMRGEMTEGPGVVWIGRDLTEIRAGQRAAKESQQRMEDFFSHSPLGIAIFDSERRLVTSNKAVYRMFGMPDGHEFEHFNLFENRFLPPDARQALSRGDSIHCEIVLDFKDIREKGLFVSHRRDKGHFDIVISNMGLDKAYKPRGYFAQISDVTQKHKIEAELMRLQTAGPSKDGVAGNLEDMALTDIMQVLCAGGRNMQISVANRGAKASVFIQAGTVTHCESDGRSGEDAFYELMRWKQGQFTAAPCEKFPAKTVNVSLMSLMMEGARRMDETAPDGGG